jgi:RNA polymerase sigma-70 factor (ECF subfamily)
MMADDPSSIQTRPSLLNRLKSVDDSESWNDFYRSYGKLVRDFALKAGLNDSEADEVVQETTIAMSRHLPKYVYDPKICRFKTWLLNQASWRIKDQLKKRRKHAAVAFSSGANPCALSADDTSRTSTINRLPDPAGGDLDNLFEVEWRKTLFDTALIEVQKKFTPKQIQIFDLAAMKEWPAADVARSLGVSTANVYVIRHRISAAIKKEISRLEAKLDRDLLHSCTGSNRSPKTV